MPIVDANDGFDAIAESYDVAIIGAGPAGIILALELSRMGLQVVMCDGGGRERTDQSQNIYKGETTPNYYPLDAARLRFFGGSSNHWGGCCHFLDESDFAARPSGSVPGWPITRSEIEPYFARAREMVDLPPLPPTPDAAVALDRNLNAVMASPVRSSVLEFSPITSFAVAYRRLLEEAPDVLVALNANVVDVTPSGTGIRAVTLRNWYNTTTQVKADRIVFAAGGLETPRLLLNFAARHDIFGAVAPLLGTHFMEHLCIYSGAVLAASGRDVEALATMTGEVGPRPGSYQWIGTIDPDARADNAITTHVSFALDKPFLQPLADVTQAPPGRGMQELLALSGSRADAGLFITVRAEQSPNAASRVSLLKGTDELGLRRIRLDWRYTPSDYSSIVRSLGLFARNVAAAGLGRVFVPDDNTNWASEHGRPVGGFHHMGTTRMSESAATGVVDGDLRIHGTDNVYVAGSSVFSTAGWAHPTINLVTLSLRLADHLART